MRKTLSYTSLILTALFVVALFFTARTYTQLTAATLLYIPLAYFAFKSLAGRSRRDQPPKVETIKESATNESEEGHVVDIDKRAFLNLIGAAGLSLFLYSLFSKSGSSLLFGKNATPSGGTKLQDADGKTINPAQHQPLDGYRISEIDDTNSQTYYGFTNKDGAWLIMKEDAHTSSFRYVKGDTAFPDNWGSRDTLNYDYYFNVF